MPYSAAQIRALQAEADAPHYAEAKRRAEFDDAMRWAGAKIDAALHCITGLEPDWQLRAVAKARAAAMLNLIRDYEQRITPEWLNAQVTTLQAAPLAFKHGTGRDDEQLQAMVKRATCHLWWRRQLRRAAVRTRETAAMHAGEVCARRKQPYVTNDTVRRYAEADKRNREMLEATELESADGEVINLLQAVEASTANKAIRRGELMTRIRGAEEWAEARGMVGLFTTNTAPSRFHSQLMKAGANPKHDGSTPKDAQQWLCKTWARARAKLQRQAVRVFGYRVAEPHHDGCPHWHMLLWCDPAQVEELRETIRAYWLAEDGEEPGAQEHRFKAKDLEAGGAVSYVAKYISKGIDDAGKIGAEGHTDERGGEQADMFEGNANRVQRWAAAWGIRQFQAIGQPPVTVWRELRRVTDQAAQGATITVQAAHAAVSKTIGRRADWRAYMDAQGGAMQGRAYAVRVLDDGEPREGRYGTEYRPRPVGVYDVEAPDEWILSARKEWKTRGTWGVDERLDMRAQMPWTQAGRDYLGEQRRRGEIEQFLNAYRAPAGANGKRAEPAFVAALVTGLNEAQARPQAAQPWTRVINCTQGRQQGADLMGLGLVGALRIEPGAANPKEIYASHPPNHRGRSPDASGQRL